MNREQAMRFGDYDGRPLSFDAQFLTRYVQEAGDQAWTLRNVATFGRKEDDGTLVGTADFANHRLFVRSAQRAYGFDVPIHSEEGLHLRPGEHAIAVAADSLDGTGEYAATHWDPSAERFIRQHNGVPLPPDAILIDDAERSTCVVAGTFREGTLWSAAMFAPYTNELLVADREMGGTYLNGHRIDLSREPGRSKRLLQAACRMTFRRGAGRCWIPAICGEI